MRWCWYHAQDYDTAVKYILGKYATAFIHPNNTPNSHDIRCIPLITLMCTYQICVHLYIRSFQMRNTHVCSTRFWIGKPSLRDAWMSQSLSEPSPLAPGIRFFIQAMFVVSFCLRNKELCAAYRIRRTIF